MVVHRASTIALVALLAACNGEDDVDPPPADLTPPAVGDTVGGTALDVDAGLPVLIASAFQRIEGSGADSAAGTVRILRSSEPDGALTLTIELNEVPPGRHGWEIREGPCRAANDERGTAVGSVGTAGSIGVGEAGFGEASAMLPAGIIDVDELGRARYDLVVLAAGNASDGPVIIACADL